MRVKFDLLTEEELEIFLAKTHISVAMINKMAGLDANENIVYPSQCYGTLMPTFCGGIERYDGKMVTKKEVCKECWDKAEDAQNRFYEGNR